MEATRPSSSQWTTFDLDDLFERSIVLIINLSFRFGIDDVAFHSVQYSKDIFCIV